MASNRQYELVVLGATGFTGRLCTEYITKHFPTDFRWAVAGRSEAKLVSIVEANKECNPDRLQPGIEVVQLDKEQLNALAKKTVCVINGIGPYHLYSLPVVEACVDNGTNYLDFAGELGYIKQVISKCHDIAKRTGSIVIPCCGVEAAPSDMLSHLLATHTPSPASITTSVHELTARVSGGTAASAVSMMSVSAMREMSDPYIISAKPAKPPPFQFPVLKNKHLGPLTFSISSAPDIAVVNRSAMLMPQTYNYPTFVFNEFAAARSRFSSFVWCTSLVTTFALLLVCPPLRWAMKKLLPQPGEGPQNVEHDCIELRSVSTSSLAGENVRYARFRWVGGLYQVSAMVSCEAAMTIVRGDGGEARKVGGGVLTPAMLGTEYLERMRSAGALFEVSEEKMW